MPPDLQEACAFGARLENRSPFILDPRLSWAAEFPADSRVYQM